MRANPSYRALFFHFQYITDIVFFWWTLWPVPLQAEPSDPGLEQLRALWRCRDTARGQHVYRFTELTKTESKHTNPIQEKGFKVRPKKAPILHPYKSDTVAIVFAHTHTHTPTWLPCHFWLLDGMSIWTLARAWSPCTASEGHSSTAQTLLYLSPAQTTIQT